MVSFLNVFLSYLILLLIIVIAAGIAVTIGISLRKKKDREEAALNMDSPDTADSR